MGQAMMNEDALDGAIGYANSSLPQFLRKIFKPNKIL